MTFAGVFRYEFRMQITRVAPWIAMAALAALFLTLEVRAAPRGQLGADIAAAAVKLNWLAPMIAGVLLADRLIRDRRLHTGELLDATGSARMTRLWGKYLGTTAAIAVPIAAIWLITLTRFAIVREQPAAYGIGALCFLAIHVPGLLFVTGFALVCPVVINSILFRVLFVGYWLWGNLLSPGYLPTLAGTVLTPIGDYARAGLFGGANPYEGTGIGAPDHTSIATATLSIVLLLMLPVLAVTGFGLSSRTPR